MVLNETNEFPSKNGDELVRRVYCHVDEDELFIVRSEAFVSKNRVLDCPFLTSWVLRMMLIFGDLQRFIVLADVLSRKVGEIKYVLLLVFVDD